jgi:hypothetical protein
VIKYHKLHLGVLAIAAMASLLFIPVASATVVGVLDVSNCLSGNVSVTSNTIDFLTTAGTGLGCLAGQAGVGGLSYGPSASTPFTAGDGTIKDLTLVPPTSGLGFMVFPQPLGVTVTFDLLGFGPGVSNTTCALPQPCSVSPGSPFILDAFTSGAGDGTTVTLPAHGLASDSLPGGVSSNFTGAFTTQISGQTPAQIQATILTSGGSITSTFSGEFTSSAIPEPVSMALIGGGLITLALLRRRQRRRA